MRMPALAVMSCLCVFSLFAAHAGGQDAGGAAQQDPFAGVVTASSSTGTPAPLLPGLRDEAVARAIRETLAENPVPGRPDGGTALSGDSAAYTKFARGFEQAAKGHCLGPDALKHQPASRVVRTVLGDFNVGVGGVFALPFWGAAVLRGKCSWRK